MTGPIVIIRLSQFDLTNLDFQLELSSVKLKLANSCELPCQYGAVYTSEVFLYSGKIFLLVCSLLGLPHLSTKNSYFHTIL